MPLRADWTNVSGVQADVLREVVELHRFFVDWFRGRCAGGEADYDRLFAARLAPSFAMVPPAGKIVTRADLLTGMREAYGSNPAFAIAIRNCELRWEGERHLLATYEEWQRGAVHSKPSDNARMATVLLRRREGELPFEWLHLHETWMPEEDRAAGDFNF